MDLDSKDLDCIKQQDAQQLYVFKLSREAHSAKLAASWPTAAPLPSQAEEMTSRGRTPTQIGWLFFPIQLAMVQHNNDHLKTTKMQIISGLVCALPITRQDDTVSNTHTHFLAAIRSTPPHHPAPLACGMLCIFHIFALLWPDISCWVATGNC